LPVWQRQRSVSSSPRVQVQWTSLLPSSPQG